MQIAFLTLGCKSNFYETEQMIKAFKEKGFSIVDFDREADVYVINTCTVTNIADRKSRQMIHKAKKNVPQALIVATGCYVDSAHDTDESIDLALGNKDKPKLVDRVVEELKKRNPENLPDAVCDPREGCEIHTAQGEDLHKQRTRAFIKVQDGCNQFCSYCLIPYVRGRGELSSTPEEDVVKEVCERVKQGCREVVLTGIHLSSYGVNEKGANGFVHEKGLPLQSLIKKVNDIDGLKRIRLGSLEPRIITKEWLEGLKDCEKLCPHFHLSLQSGCDTTLKRMNRHYTTDEYMERVELIRQFYEHPAITTDVIVGFPGETDEEFDQTLRFLEKVGFADLHIFQYSMRDGTVAAKMPDQVSPEMKKRRSEILINEAKNWRKAYIEAQDTPAKTILFEEYEDKEGTEYLCGFNERYVRYGVRRERAEKEGFVPGEVYVTDADLTIF